MLKQDTCKVRLEPYIVENTKIKYDQVTAGVLYCSKSKNDVLLVNLFKMQKKRYERVLILLKMLNKGTAKVRLEIYCVKKQN